MESQTKPQLKIIYRIHGRGTNMGAYTTIKVVSVERGVIEVKRVNYSKSGKHWVEELWVSEDAVGIVKVVDISNSGKNYSYFLKIENGEVKRL